MPYSDCETRSARWLRVVGIYDAKVRPLRRKAGDERKLGPVRRKSRTSTSVAGIEADCVVESERERGVHTSAHAAQMTQSIRLASLIGLSAREQQL